MSTLAKPTLENKAQMAESFAKGVTTIPKKNKESTAKNRVFYAPEGFRRLTINVPEDIFKKIRLQTIEEDCTITEIVTRLLEKQFK